ncbi:hypothetical protein DFH09DRAFT_1308583 [Mycena vulgaris]|nr:hypothetical protein DFH09DRAFT_1308583 [Mycena vulgaris]
MPLELEVRWQCGKPTPPLHAAAVRCRVACHPTTSFHSALSTPALSGSPTPASAVLPSPTPASSVPTSSASISPTPASSTLAMSASTSASSAPASYLPTLARLPYLPSLADLLVDAGT